MNGIKKLLLILMFVFPFVIVDASCINSDGTGKKGSVSLSASSLSVYVGKKTTFKVSAPCAAGKIIVKSSDTSIATVSPTEDFVDDSSLTITVKGKSAGKVTISVVLDDVADYASNVLSGTKKVTLTVKKEETQTKSSTTTKTQTSNKTTETKTETQKPKEIKISKFDIIGYNIDFDPNILEYTIDVSENVNKLYIVVQGENFSVTGNKEVNIEGKDSVVVSLKNENKVVNYTIKINRETSVTMVAPEIKEVTKEVLVTDKKYLYTTIGLSILCIVLVVLLIKKKSTIKKNTNTSTVQERPITPMQTTNINTNTTYATPTITNNQSSFANQIETMDLSSNNQIDNNLK